MVEGWRVIEKVFLVWRAGVVGVEAFVPEANEEDAFSGALEVYAGGAWRDLYGWSPVSDVESLTVQEGELLSAKSPVMFTGLWVCLDNLIVRLRGLCECLPCGR